MLSKIWTLSVLCAVSFAAPTIVPSSASASEQPAEMTILSDYFKLLGQEVKNLKAGGQAPACDFSKASMPVASPTPLPAVGAGFHLKHISIGRGVQNYTCDLSNSTAIPTAIGAIATLYDATCLGSTYPSILALTPPVALQFPLRSPSQASLTPSNLVIVGHHYFDSTGTPTFDLDSAGKGLGTAACAKNASAPAPETAIVGQGGEGFGSVPWLKLTVKKSTGGIQEVYRINTAGGKPPATCAGQKAAFEIEYATEYWFYGN